VLILAPLNQVLTQYCVQCNKLPAKQETACLIFLIVKWLSVAEREQQEVRRRNSSRQDMMKWFNKLSTLFDNLFDNSQITQNTMEMHSYLLHRLK